MITVITKKIDNGNIIPKGQRAYAAALLNYMNAPESRGRTQLIDYMNSPESIKQTGAGEIRREKCVATLCRNFSKPVMSPSEMAAEMAADCALSTRLANGQGIDHWVISWKCGDREHVEAGEIFDAVDRWILDMGYGGGSYKWTASIHKDTEHTHAHVAICRVDAFSGKVKPRGMWKTANQMALARMAADNGWKLEAGSCKFVRAPGQTDKVEIRDEVLGKVETVRRPSVIEVEKARFPVIHLSGQKAKVRSGASKNAKKVLRTREERVADQFEKDFEKLRRSMKGKPIPVTREMAAELERRGYKIRKVKREEWISLARDLDQEIRKKPDEFVDSVKEINEMNVEFMRAKKLENWGRPEGAKKPYYAGDKAERIESFQQVKSGKRALAEALREAYDSMKDELPGMKWGMIHRRLAEYGIEMQRREHDGRYGIVFSLDGEHWQSAGKVCKEMTWGRLNGHIGAKKDSWREANENARVALEEARLKFDLEESATSSESNPSPVPAPMPSKKASGAGPQPVKKPEEQKPEEKKAVEKKEAEPEPGLDEFMAGLRECDIPDWLLKTGDDAKACYLAKYHGGEKCDVGEEIARALCAIHANPDEVYSFLRREMGSWKKNLMRADADREARRIAAVMATHRLAFEKWRRGNARQDKAEAERRLYWRAEEDFRERRRIVNGLWEGMPQKKPERNNQESQQKSELIK